MNKSSINDRDEMMNTALHGAVYRKDLELVEILLANNIDIEGENDKSQTAIRIASAHGFIEIAKKLLEKGANPNKAGAFGLTSMHMAAFNNNLDMMKLLEDYAGDINALSDTGLTTLHCCASGIGKNPTFELLEWLIINNVDYYIRNKQNISVYEYLDLMAEEYSQKFNYIISNLIGENCENSDMFN